MKPLILPFLLLLAVMLTVGWMQGRFGNSFSMMMKPKNGKVLYFEPQLSLVLGKTGEFNLVTNYGSPVTAFDIEFLYDPKIIVIEKVLVNGQTFDQNVVTNVDQYSGRVILKAVSGIKDNLKGGIQKLATINVRAIKSGEVNLIRGEKKSVTVFENGQSLQGDFQMQSFKVSVK